MNAPDTTVYYKGFVIQPLVFKQAGKIRPGEVIYDISVKIEQINESTGTGEVFSVTSPTPLYSLGDARRVAVSRAYAIIDEKLRGK